MSMHPVFFYTIFLHVLHDKSLFNIFKIFEKYIVIKIIFERRAVFFMRFKIR